MSGAKRRRRIEFRIPGCLHGRSSITRTGLSRAAESEDNRTEIGGRRILERPYGELLPRIC